MQVDKKIGNDMSIVHSDALGGFASMQECKWVSVTTQRGQSPPTNGSHWLKEAVKCQILWWLHLIVC